MFTRILLLTVIFTLTVLAQPAPVPHIGHLGLPELRWMPHILKDLMPFWNHPDAFGTPPGAFPTTRCDDGSRVDWARPCPEVGGNSWLMLRQQYTVALSRQIYTYGVLFHTTGNPGFLHAMKTGVDHLRANAIDRTGGGMFTIQQSNGSWGPKRELRDPQQLAYGLLGMSFYYYLTRDQEVLADILAIKKYIFDTYYNPSINALQWQLEDSSGQPALDRRLTAQLDQMNAYLVLMTPLLPQPHRAEWEDSLRLISRIMRQEFYNPKENLFFLRANSPDDLNPELNGADFGHSIKAFWMMRLASLILGDAELLNFSREGATALLARAYDPASGSWYNGVNKGGAIDNIKSWWVYAELDQYAATAALSEPAIATYLPRTTAYWLNNFVDKDFGEVWNSVDGATNTPIRTMPKQWPWKNGYHSLEHALVNHIYEHRYEGRRLHLYYAFKHWPEDGVVRPYFFDGWVYTAFTSPDGRGGLVWDIAFFNIR